MTLPDALSALCPGGVARDVPLSRISRWRVGGLADVLVDPGSIAELAALRAFLHREGLAHVVIGSTTNLLFSDDGLRAVCIRIGNRMAGLQVEGTRVRAEAGLWAPALARRVMLAGLSGAEHICGIPGTLGGLLAMNGGSRRQSIGSVVETVESIDPAGARRLRTGTDCGFGYRRSVFQDNGEVITRVQLRLIPAADRAAVRREMLTIMTARRRKFPRWPNCGSVFKSRPETYAEIGPPGAVIERLGFKGRRIGDALVSPRHANFIVNAGQARAADIVLLIREIRDAVARETGHRLEAEVRFVRPDGVMVAADAGGAVRDAA